MYNLFAITKPDAQVSRVRLDAANQKKLGTMIEAQADELLDEDRARHKYAPMFAPTDGGIVTLEFTLPDDIAALTPTIPGQLPVLAIDDVEKCAAKALIAIDGKRERFCFQSVDKRSFLGPRRGVLFFGQDSNKIEDLPGIALAPRLDALYEDGVLYFTSEAVVRRFLSLDAVFNAATDKEVTALLTTSTHFTGFTKSILEHTSQWARRKVSYVQQSNILTMVSAKDLSNAAKLCGIALSMRSGKIVVPSTSPELRELLKFLSEDFLESPLRPKVIFEVHSKKAMNQ